MKITPQDIHHKEFKRALRGYSEEDVDLFLDQLAEQYENLYKQNHGLDEEVQQLKEKIKTYQNMELTLQNTLLTAQKSAEEVQMNAKKEADLVVNNANLDAKNSLEKAEKQKQALNETFAKLKNLEGSFKTKIKGDLKGLLGKLDEIDQQEEDILQKIEKEFASIEEIEIPRVKKEVIAEAKAAAQEKKEENEAKEEAQPAKEEAEDPVETSVAAEAVSAPADASKSDIASEEEIDKFLQQEPATVPSNGNGDEKKNGLLGRFFGRKTEGEESASAEATADKGEEEVVLEEVAAAPKKKAKAKKNKKKNTEEIES